MALSLMAYAAGVLSLTVAEMRGSAWQRVLKPVLAVAFVVTAVLVGGISTTFALLMTAGLAACAVGDVMLLSRDETPFLLGMVAFGLGHVLFIGAFWDVRAMDVGLVEVLVALVVIGIGVGTFARMGPRGLGWAAGLYSMLIAAMIATALLTRQPQLIAGALAFAVSDAIVAQNRFNAPKPWHYLLITPLYFGAQMAFALSPALLAL